MDIRDRGGASPGANVLQADFRAGVAPSPGPNVRVPPAAGGAPAPLRIDPSEPLTDIELPMVPTEVGLYGFDGVRGELGSPTFHVVLALEPGACG